MIICPSFLYNKIDKVVVLYDLYILLILIGIRIDFPTNMLIYQNILILKLGRNSDAFYSNIHILSIMYLHFVSS